MWDSAAKYKAKFDAEVVLSILYVRFIDGKLTMEAGVLNFQFSMWDSRMGVFRVKPIASAFNSLCEILFGLVNLILW